ncbi:MAG: ribosome-binding factor A [Victivallaceae bacterium]|nr:ribosome-binding factor A [Victivallaceae bacterium]
MPKKVDRMTRVNELIKREMANLLTTGGFFPAGVLVSVTEVKASTDLRNATIMLSFLGGKASDREETLHEIETRRVSWQHGLAVRLGFKHTPVLLFKVDRRIAAGDRVLALLEKEEDPHRG